MFVEILLGILIGRSEEFQLLSWRIGFHLFLTDVEFNIRKLFVGDAETSHLPVSRQECLHPFEVYIGILATGAMPDVDRELEHGESVANQILAEVGSRFAFSFGIGRQVEKHKQPHDAVFAEAVHHISG